MSNTLKIITRTSMLALWQANYVRDCLLQHKPTLSIEIIGIQTTADKWQDIPLYKMGGKSLFVKELENALLEGTADIAVHSLKDVSAQLPAGLMLGAILPREDPRDAWICPQGFTFDTLPPGSRVGTSSLRRLVQLKRLRDDLTIIPLRGNVDTRLKKCAQGEFDAIILAMAGLSRLGFTAQVTACFTPQQLLPAVGQGALAIECRSDDSDTRALIAALDDQATHACVMAERAMNARLGGSCQLPVAGYAEFKNKRLQLVGRVGCPDTSHMIEAYAEGDVPEAVGEAVAQSLFAQGAQDIIDKLS